MEVVIKFGQGPMTSALGQVSPEGCRARMALHCAHPNSERTHQLRVGTLWITEDAKSIEENSAYETYWLVSCHLASYY